MDKRVRGAWLAGLTALAATAAAALARETIAYAYDARGRLVRVERSGKVNDKVKAEYKYDKADNRTQLDVASPNPPPKQ